MEDEGNTFPCGTRLDASRILTAARPFISLFESRDCRINRFLRMYAVSAELRSLQWHFLYRTEHATL